MPRSAAAATMITDPLNLILGSKAEALTTSQLRPLASRNARASMAIFLLALSSSWMMSDVEAGDSSISIFSNHFSKSPVRTSLSLSTCTVL
ncbi:hypothetical protein D9M73_293740 [compost metagenome]